MPNAMEHAHWHIGGYNLKENQEYIILKEVNFAGQRGKSPFATRMMERIEVQCRQREQRVWTGTFRKRFHKGWEFELHLLVLLQDF